jgi:hypothetical protein
MIRPLMLLALVATGCPEQCDVEPTYESINERYFGTSCAFSTCHSGSAATGDLDLTGDPHDWLIDVIADNEAAAAAGKKRIVPGDADSSFLVQKLEGTLTADEGAMMPDGAVEPLDPECRILTLREWIDAGAPI